MNVCLQGQDCTCILVDMMLDMALFRMLDMAFFRLLDMAFIRYDIVIFRWTAIEVQKENHIVVT